MNLWKKTLLATAVAAISTGAMAAAVTPATTVKNISQEGYAVAPANTKVDANSVSVHSGVNWSKDDLITFTLEGATFASGQALDFVNVVADKASFTLLSQTETTAVFRVAQIINTGGITAGQDFVFGVANTATTVTAPEVILPANVDEGHEVTLTAVVTTSAGQVIDETKADTGVIVKTAPQFSLPARTTQVPTAYAQLSTDFETLVADKDGTAIAPAAGTLAMQTVYASDATLQVPFVVSAQDVIVTGPIAAFDNSENTANGTITAVGATNTEFGNGSVTFTTPAALSVDVDAVQSAARGDDTVAIEAGKFYSSFVLRNAAGDEVKLGSQDNIGRLFLDSLSAEIPYLPVGDAVTPFVWVTNHGSLPGAIHATAMTVNGMVYDLGVVANAKPGLTKVDTAIVQALKDAGVNTQYETINLELYIEDVNRAADGTSDVINDVSVYAAYKHIGDSDRLQVPVYLSTEANKID
jgi:hypothetical protein